MLTRTKPPSSNSNTGPAAPSKGSVLADPSAQNKRKREALGEVTGKSVNNIRSSKPALDAKGKGKETATIVKPAKPTTTSTSTTANARAPLRTVSTRTRPATIKVQKDDKIVVDRRAKAVPVVEIPAPAATITRTTSRAKSSSSSTATITTRRSALKKPVAVVRPEIVEEPLTKRRKTSSEIGDEAHLENIVEESEPVDAGVENIAHGHIEDVVEQEQDWDDLDRDDDDDPLMVSEYVADIFNYLKVVEVCGFKYYFFNIH